MQQSPTGAQEQDLALRQLGLLEHRGPDAAGVVSVGRAVLGQQRLAVIDLVTGDPPITNEDESVAVAFNGEIYNFRGVRAWLSRLGHQFTTSGDTEVIVHLAEEVSPLQLAHDLEGMFAFAVYDNRQRRLILARDRLGKKPLYWWYGQDTLVFASEIKALLVHPAVPRALNEDALAPYLTLGYAPTPSTFFAGINSLPPGHVLTWSEGEHPRIEEYWRPPLPARSAAAIRPPTLKEAVRDTRQLVHDAVQRRLISDVPLGAFLSGGVDSSVIVAVMTNLGVDRVRTFTVGFEESGFDERPYAREIARRFGTDHTEFVVNPDKVELIERLLWHHDQPFGDSSAIPTYLLSECTRKHVTVALSGDGGDEVFAGYERFAAGTIFAKYLTLPRAFRHGVSELSDRLPPASRRSRMDSLRRLLSSGDQELLRTYANWVAYLPEPIRCSMVGREREYSQSLQSYERVWQDSEGHGVLARLLDLNARTYLLDDLLVKMDRMSMAHGLEVRSPFLDTRLVNYAFRLPASLKVRGPRLKYLLKEAFAHELPDSILKRRKQGFGIPLDLWFRTDLRSYVHGMLGPGSRVRHRLNPDAVDDLLSVHDSGRRNYGHGIWALLTLEMFLRREGW